MIQLIATPNLLFVLNPFVDRFMEGGPLFMSLILICLILSIFFIVKGFLNLSKNVTDTKKMMRLSSETGLLGLVIGFLGSILGLIQAFDSIEGVGGEISAGLLASGLKVTFLTVVFGAFTFIISRIGILVLKWKLKE